MNRSVLGVVALLAVGCVSWEEIEAEDLRYRTASGISGTDGRFRARIPVGPDDDVMLLTASTRGGERLVFTDRIVAPDGTVVFRGEDWWDGVRNKSNGAFASTVTSVGWPILPTDVPLTEGTWTVVFRADVANVPLDVSVALKEDDDLRSGRLDTEVLFLDGLGSDRALRSGVETAVAVWADELYASWGLELNATYNDADGPGQLASPGFGDEETYRGLLVGKRLRTIPVFVVDQISGGVNIFGAAGGIPGPMQPSDRSAVVVSAREAAGADGSFSAVEETVLAETLAHEVGHYLGLFHPVELPNNDQGIVSTFDAVDDTPECGVFDACQDVLGSNLMFPTPLCTAFEGLDCVSFDRQDELTPTQQAVAHRYAAVR